MIKFNGHPVVGFGDAAATSPLRETGSAWTRVWEVGTVTLAGAAIPALIGAGLGSIVKHPGVGALVGGGLATAVLAPVAWGMTGDRP